MLTSNRLYRDCPSKHGVKDQDYPDIPIGGWAGSIVEVADDGIYTVRWSDETLASIHPVFKQRCEKDGLEFDRYWLDESDLELDNGDPLDIEQPTKITTKPLSPKNQDDRIRMVFGLTSNDPLPDVDHETLESYREHLLNNLVFPFPAQYRADYRSPAEVKVIGLGDPEDAPMIDEDYGILCEVRSEGHLSIRPLGEMEVAKGKPSRQLVGDYSYWFHNWR
ncbi:hypothetical protein NZK35_20930 [Stieleria sp. ICT_E10.1]|uniref:calcium-binding protein n=1 Tax=Stieleria sedimenti TaxID=2976331 RepID=UPI00218095D7|nr:calcium-binding protein [Stieleria sedimenti]MCS7469125.1 hypothetical protein [Stieleria sedimenti]